MTVIYGTEAPYYGQASGFKITHEGENIYTSYFIMFLK